MSYPRAEWLNRFHNMRYVCSGPPWWLRLFGRRISTVDNGYVLRFLRFRGKLWCIGIDEPKPRDPQAPTEER